MSNAAATILRGLEQVSGLVLGAAGAALPGGWGLAAGAARAALGFAADLIERGADAPAVLARLRDASAAFATVDAAHDAELERLVREGTPPAGGPR